MFKFKIDTDIELRILEIRHATELYMLIKDNIKHLEEWFDWVSNEIELDDIKSFIKSGLEQYANSNGFHSGIWYKDEIVGVIGYNDMNWHSKNVNIGYWLGSQHQHNGIMTKACKAMVDYAFNELELHKVEIRCAEENVKSRAIPKRLEFIEEGKLRDIELLGDRYYSQVVYGILNSEWQNLTN